jgi:pseudouridine-5'-monophosphatase
LKNARGQDGKKIQVAMASSSTTRLYGLKVSPSEIADVFRNVFNENNRVLGDNPGVKAGRGKPAPDIYLLALDAINAKLEDKIKPKECLVFEDSIPGIEARRRASMSVIWVPHPELRLEYKGREEEVWRLKMASGKSMTKRRSSYAVLGWMGPLPGEFSGLFVPEIWN